jgi:hypothetical protein
VEYDGRLRAAVLFSAAGLRKKSKGAAGPGGKLATSVPGESPQIAERGAAEGEISRNRSGP